MGYACLAHKPASVSPAPELRRGLWPAGSFDQLQGAPPLHYHVAELSQPQARCTSNTAHRPRLDLAAPPESVEGAQSQTGPRLR